MSHDFEHWSERLRRLVCRWVGHRAVHERRGEPVCSFYVCRCGKYGR